MNRWIPVFSAAAGNEEDFRTYTANAKVYFPGFAKGHALALQGVTDLRTGRPPFQMLPGLGDGSILHG